MTIHGMYERSCIQTENGEIYTVTHKAKRKEADEENEKEEEVNEWNETHTRHGKRERAFIYVNV